MTVIDALIRQCCDGPKASKTVPTYVFGDINTADILLPLTVSHTETDVDRCQPREKSVVG